MSWILLLIAGALEIAWVVALKHSGGFSRPFATLVTLLAAALSIALLAQAARTLPLSTAYAVWTAIGVGGSIVAGMILFGEPVSAARLLCLAMILAGVVGLKVLAA